VKFDLLAVNLDQKQPGFPAHVLPDYLTALSVPFHIIEQDTYSVVKRVIPEGKTMCGLCSRLRRGALYRYASENGITKIALGHHRDDIVETLWSYGVPVAKVMQPHRQSELPQLAARDFFEDVDHPVNPRSPHSTLPFTSTRGPGRIHLQPAPLLGQHNRELLAELGLSDKDIDELESQGVIGTAPAMHGSKV